MEIAPIQKPAIDNFVELSRTHLVSVVFPKTRSPYYAHAVDVAAQAQQYCVLQGHVGIIHACAFEKSSMGAAMALQLLKWVKGWAGVQVFTLGRASHDLDEIGCTLLCYQEGLATTDAKAHCLCVTDDAFRSMQPPMAALVITLAADPLPPRPKPVRLTVPCVRVLSRFRVEPDHPSSWSDQFQAATVRQSTDWCPLLDMAAFRQYE